jgi:hypothetical protein
MKTVCQHCNAILKDDGGKDDDLSHGDCFQYKGKPCAEGEKYFRNLANQYNEDYHQFLDSIRPTNSA